MAYACCKYRFLPPSIVNIFFCCFYQLIFSQKECPLWKYATAVALTKIISVSFFCLSHQLESSSPLPSSKSSVVTSSNVSVQSTIYGISSNNSRPSINRLPRIMVLHLTEILKMIDSLEQLPLPAPLAIFSCFYPLPVNLKCNEIQQNWSVTIHALKINQGTKFGTLKNPMFSLFDVFILMGK